MRFPAILRIAGLWLIWVTWSQITGWGLSAMGALHAVGYLSLLPLLILPSAIFWHMTSPGRGSPHAVAKWLRRIKSSPILMAWCIISTLVLFGALAHAPTNYDGVTYRLPRLLYWLQENRWHWIDGLDHRQNVSGLGHEWMIAPFIAITRSDRALFLINFIPFLLLPGLFFIAARGLDIRARVAKWWMWVWPMAYGITLQAGGIGNDLLPAALGLAALAFTAQATRSRPVLCLFFAALAAAAMTGAKSTSIPLALPIGIYWLRVAWQTVHWQGIIRAAAAAMPLAIPCSVIPLSIACIIHTGHWAGNPGNRHGAQAGHPVAGIIGNSMQITGGLVQLPVLPPGKKIEAWLDTKARNHAWYRWEKSYYPLSGFGIGGELPMEEQSGAGIAITLLLIMAVFARYANRAKYAAALTPIQWAILCTTLVAIVAFMAKLGTGGTARLSLPYLPIAVLCVLFTIRRQPPASIALGKFAQSLPAICLVPALILNPNRPLIPTESISNHSAVPANVRIRIDEVYRAYQHRSTILTPLLENIPASQTIGFAGCGNHSALGLFKPYGSRKVLNLTPQNEARIDWVVAIPEMLEKRMHMPLADWEAKSDFEKVGQKNIISLASVGPETWLIYRRTSPSH